MLNLARRKRTDETGNRLEALRVAERREIDDIERNLSATDGQVELAFDPFEIRTNVVRPGREGTLRGFV